MHQAKYQWIYGHTSESWTIKYRFNFSQRTWLYFEFSGACLVCHIISYIWTFSEYVTVNSFLLIVVRF